MNDQRNAISAPLPRHALGLWSVLILALVGTACGSGETSTGGDGGSGNSGNPGGGQTTSQGGSGGQATTTGQGGGQTTTTGEGGGTGGGGGTPQPKTPGCFFQCGAAADCYSASALPPFDGDNYACENSFCIYKGCNNTQECVDTYGDTVSCKAFPGSTVKSCNLDCSTAADCYSAGSAPPFDGDNYACENGFCIYKGCNNTQECVDAYGDTVSCKAFPGSTVKTCNLDCSTVSDCYSPGALPPVDGDNYACENGFCIYKGCNNTQECVDAYGSDVICTEGP